MHEFHDHLVRDSRRARTQNCSSLARYRCRLLANAFGVLTARIDRFITEHGKAPYPDMEWSRSWTVIEALAMGRRLFDWLLRTVQRDCFDDDGPHRNPLPEGEESAKRQVSVK